MQVHDQVKVKAAAEDDQDAIGRAGVVIKVEKNPDNPDDQLCHVELDETQEYESGIDVYTESQLEFLGR